MVSQNYVVVVTQRSGSEKVGLNLYYHTYEEAVRARKTVLRYSNTISACILANVPKEERIS